MLQVAGLAAWSLFLGKYSNNFPQGEKWKRFTSGPEPECEICGDKPAYFYEELCQVLCNHHYDYEVNYDQYWDGRP